MVAYAYAAQYPAEVDRIALMDAFLPGVGDGSDRSSCCAIMWHFHFYGETPLKLVTGRERIYFEHFWNGFAANPKKSVSEADRAVLRKAYAQPGAMTAGFEVFSGVRPGRQGFRGARQTKLKMPMLVLTGEKASGEFLIQQGRMVADNGGRGHSGPGGRSAGHFRSRAEEGRGVHRGRRGRAQPAVRHRRRPSPPPSPW